MKKVISMLIMASAMVFAISGKDIYDGNCAACHGADGKTKALDKSAQIAGMGAGVIESTIKAYKTGSQNKYGEGTTMKSSVETLSDGDIKSVADYAGSLK